MLCTTACGGNGDSKATPKDTASSTPTTSAPSATSLRESCAEVEAGLPEGMLPPAPRWQQYATELDAIAEAGDTETQNAVENLQDAVDELAADPTGMPFLDAREAMRDALDNLALRCKAVGSSALQ